MNFNEYQQLSKRTMPGTYDGKALANYALGLTGEAGECGDIIKKEVFHGHRRDPQAIKKELGDVLHYLSGLATMYGWSLEEVAMGNIEKLMKRYPSGFSKEASVQRADVNE
ncbi:nucleoside triphosphate pyrophosphohydrolase family protein [Peribacillus frigoritolerans]|uniref:nucleoside triphosphate pyrophosphohydrolase family protein n=1 Tax=Peribacillus frigoritolerans TaxID=450367 RepID=UPI002161E2E9|nr:nucleoside triphosphate pyrophosphohydrolase family protein [Peribacillus frigoritolerans]